jgi:energy-coupling factor transporter ATP-binding protein EcfA2
MAERAQRRERRRLIDARFPLIKRLEEFRFADNPKVPQATIAALAEGSWIDDREGVVLIGDSGTGKTHLAIALAVCACHQGRRVRFHHARRPRQRTPRSRLASRAWPSRQPLRPHRACHPRRAGISGAARRCRRARLPGPLRTPRTRQPDRHHEPSVRRLDQGVPRPPAREGHRGPPHPPRAHHRHRHRVLALPPRPRAPHQEGRLTPHQQVAPRPSPLRRRPTGFGSATTAAHHIRQDQPEQQPTRGGATSSVQPGASASGDTESGSTQSQAVITPRTPLYSA